MSDGTFWRTTSAAKSCGASTKITALIPQSARRGVLIISIATEKDAIITLGFWQQPFPACARRSLARQCYTLSSSRELASRRDCRRADSPPCSPVLELKLLRIARLVLRVQL